MRRLPTERSTTIELVVPKDDAKLRLDRVLAKQLPEYSRSRLQQLILAGFVRVNGITMRPSHLVRAGDKIELTEPPVEKIENQPEPIPLEILFEDKDLIVINKPAGLVVHSGELASLIECRLHSGRTHQIRVHLHHLGHPVLVDKVYAPRFAKDFPRQMLHAWKLGFCHPRTCEWKNFEAPLPDDFEQDIVAAG